MGGSEIRVLDLIRRIDPRQLTLRSCGSGIVADPSLSAGPRTLGTGYPRTAIIGRSLCEVNVGEYSVAEARALHRLRSLRMLCKRVT
ncbi:hypothetical protein SBA2_780010 [Acidobacteriia bacterium SbA2]|nr:hypothetical protein SBA2_780010 [Acidobacteriia bacterium SbA2]